MAKAYLAKKSMNEHFHDFSFVTICAFIKLQLNNEELFRTESYKIPLFAQPNGPRDL